MSIKQFKNIFIEEPKAIIKPLLCTWRQIIYGKTLSKTITTTKAFIESFGFYQIMSYRIQKQYELE